MSVTAHLLGWLGLLLVKAVVVPGLLLEFHFFRM
jgi:hypothetical protein